MSRMMNPGPPVPRALQQARSGDRPWPGEPAWHVPRPRDAAEPVARRTGDGEPTLVLQVDLTAPMPEVTGGVVTRAWLLLRVAGVPIGDLMLTVPATGLTAEDIGAAIATRIGARRRRRVVRQSDAQARSRRRGSTSSL